MAAASGGNGTACGGRSSANPSPAATSAQPRDFLTLKRNPERETCLAAEPLGQGAQAVALAQQDEGLVGDVGEPGLFPAADIPARIRS
jgi:hypothetical protein